MYSFKIILSFLLFGLCSSLYCQDRIHAIKPGQVWPDTEGRQINAHGGGIILFDGSYFLSSRMTISILQDRDRWLPDNLADSRHVWLPIEWENGNPVIKWYPNWNLSTLK